MDVEHIAKQLGIVSSKATTAKAKELVRLAGLKLTPGVLGQGTVCKSAVCLEIACDLIYPGKVITRDDFIRCCCSTAKVYQSCYTVLSRTLAVRPPPSLRDLVLRCGCLHLEPATARCLAKHRTAFLATLEGQERISADFSRPVFIAAAFCLVARQNKVKVDQHELCRDLGVSSADFAATQASMIALNPDLAPPAATKTPSAAKRRRGEAQDTGEAGSPPTSVGPATGQDAASRRKSATCAKRGKRQALCNEWDQLSAEADAVVALQIKGQRAVK